MVSHKIKLQKKVFQREYSLVVAGESESDERQVVAGECFGRREKILLHPLFLLHVIKVTCIVITCKFRDNGRDTLKRNPCTRVYIKEWKVFLSRVFFYRLKDKGCNCLEYVDTMEVSILFATLYTN